MIQDEDIASIILYEDNHLLALDKPPLLLTQDSPRVSLSLESVARRYIKKRDQKTGEAFLHAIHRLDKEACGVVLFAKSSKGLSRLNQAMREKRFSKSYLAVVQGAMKDKQGVWEDAISHGHLKAIIGEKKGSRQAKLSFRVIEQNSRLAHLMINLDTGKYHQIRVQSASRGHPILGDTKYGSCFKGKVGGIALCHKTLQFVHPVTQQPIIIDSKQSLEAWL